MTERVLVTGATGFLGRYACRLLVQEGYRVHAVVRSSARAALLPGSDLVSAHVLDRSADVGALVVRVAPTRVLHLATHFVARQGTPEELLLMLDANVTLGAVLAEACARARIPVVSTSSVWQHFEGAGYCPVSLYAATKQSMDDIVTYYALVDGLPWTRVVLGDTYGPGDDRGKLMSALLSAARTGVPLPASSGLQIWDGVHASDVARALVMCLKAEPEQGIAVYQLSSGGRTTVREVVDRLAGVAHRPVPVAWGVRPDRGREMMQPWTVAGPPPGWAPLIGLDEGLKEIWLDSASPAGGPAIGSAENRVGQDSELDPTSANNEEPA